jgi:hypothetical protein
LDQENLNSSLCIHDARNFDEYTQVLAGDTTNTMAFLGGEESASLCIALLCTILDGIEMHPIFFQLGWNLDGNWPIRRQNPYQHQFVNVNNNNYTCCAKMAGKSKNLNSRNLNGDLDAKLASCIPGLMDMFKTVRYIAGQ